MIAILRAAVSIMVLGLGFTTCASAQQLTAVPKPQPAAKNALDQLAGKWVFDEATLGKINQTGRVWSSIITIRGDAFTLSKLMDSKRDLKGTIVLDPTNRTAIDLKIQEFDLSDLGVPMKIPAGTLPSIFSLKDDRLTLCIPRTFEGERPVSFESNNNVYKATFVRAPAGFNEFPKQVEVKIVGPDGKPAVGITVAHLMTKDTTNPKKKDIEAVWEFYQSAKTGPDGIVKVKYNECELGNLIARDAENNRMAIIPLSPAILVGGKLTGTLAPECHVTGKVISEELAKAGRPVLGTVAGLKQNGNRVAYFISLDEKFEFFATPGNYTLEAYAGDTERKTVTITVPPGQSEFAIDPIAIPARALVLLRGQVAPELTDVLCWKGKTVKLSELKGQYVLLEFWGYWCAPCVRSMPVLIELHEKYADKGLAIVCVHVDGDGEVDSIAKLDDKLVRYKKELWNGKDVPFPVALVSGKRSGEDAKRGGPPAQYGIPGYPTTILIDRDGKVVGEFVARDIKKASQEIDKLLEKK